MARNIKNYSMTQLAMDFALFNMEIDKIKEKEHLSEDEALSKVVKAWQFPALPEPIGG